MSNKDVEDYMRGSSGDMFASGWGQVGYEMHKQRQAREQERIRSLGARSSASSESGGTGSSKNLVMMVFVVIAFEAVMNFTGLLASDFQRIAAFVFAVVAGTIVNLYWVIIVRVFTAAILLGGAILLVDAFWGG